MLNMDMIFGIGFIALFAICMLIGALVGLKRGFFPTLLRLGMILFCFLITIPLTNLVSRILSRYVPDILLMLGISAEEIAAYSPSTMELIQQLPFALIAPILYIVIFYLLKCITMIVFRFTKGLLPKSTSTLFRILGCASGAVTSLVCLLAVCLPLWGLIGICHRTVQTVTEIDLQGNEELSSTLAQVDALDDAIIVPAVNNFTAKIFTNDGSNLLYKHITKLNLHGNKMFLGDELQLVTHTAADAFALVGSLSDNFALTDLNEQQITDLRKITADIDSSELLKNIFSEWVSAAARTWKNGEALFGIEDPAANTSIKPIAHSLYGFLATTNVDLLVGDINLFVDVLDVLIRYEVLTAEQTELLETFGSDAFMNDLTTPLSEHDRIRTSLSELTASTTGAWANGTDYMGLSEPQMSTEYRAILRAGYGFLATTNESVFVEDLKMLSDLVAILSKVNQSSNVLLDECFLEDLNVFLGKHTRFRDYLADWISKVAGAWKNGTDYMGFAEPQIDESLRPILRAGYGFLATTDKTVFAEDFRTLSDLISIALKTEKSTKMFFDESFLDQLNVFLNDHDRFRNYLADWIAGVAEAWENGTDYNGLAEPKIQDDYRTILRAGYGFLATTNKTVFAEDFKTLTGLASIVGKVSESSNVLLDDVFLENLNTFLGDHTRFRDYLAQWISNVAGAWADGTDYKGMARPTVNQMADTVIDSLLDVLATTNTTLIHDDLAIVTDVVRVLKQYDILGKVTNSTQMGDLLKRSDFEALINDLTVPLSEHDRLRNALSELAASTTDAWSKGTDYKGIAEPQMNAEYRAILRAGYGFLATTNESLLVEDTKTLSALVSMTAKMNHSDNILLDDTFLEDLNGFLVDHIRFRDYFADWIAKVSDVWADGRDYDGMTRPVINELVDPVMVSLFDILSTTNKDLIHDDIDAMVDIMRVLKTYDIFNSVENGDQMADMLMDSNFVSDLNAAINRHERFKPMLDVVASLGLSAISSQLSISLPESEMMTNLSSSISATLNNIFGEAEKVKLEAIEGEVNKILTENEIDVPAGVTEMISQIVHNEFGNKETVSEQDVTDYLTGLYNRTDNLDGFFH